MVKCAIEKKLFRLLDSVVTILEFSHSDSDLAVIVVSSKILQRQVEAPAVSYKTMIEISMAWSFAPLATPWNKVSKIVVSYGTPTEKNHTMKSSKTSPWSLLSS